MAYLRAARRVVARQSPCGLLRLPARAAVLLAVRLADGHVDSAKRLRDVPGTTRASGISHTRAFAPTPAPLSQGTSLVGSPVGSWSRRWTTPTNGTSTQARNSRRRRNAVYCLRKNLAILCWGGATALGIVGHPQAPGLAVPPQPSAAEEPRWPRQFIQRRSVRGQASARSPRGGSGERGGGKAFHQRGLPRTGPFFR